MILMTTDPEHSVQHSYLLGNYMAWGALLRGGRRSPSVSQKKNVMISTHVRAVTHQTTKHSLYSKEKLTSPKEVLYGDKILSLTKTAWFYRDCMPRGQGLPGEGLQSSVGVSQGISYQVSFAMSLAVGLHTSAPLIISQSAPLYLGGLSDRPCVSWRLWFAQLTRLLTLQVYKCKPLTSTFSTSSRCSQVSGSDYSLYTKHSSHHHLW